MFLRIKPMTAEVTGGETFLVPVIKRSLIQIQTQHF